MCLYFKKEVNTKVGHVKFINSHSLVQAYLCISSKNGMCATKSTFKIIHTEKLKHYVVISYFHITFL